MGGEIGMKARAKDGLRKDKGAEQMAESRKEGMEGGRNRMSSERM